mgnify:CR=1 FL=1
MNDVPNKPAVIVVGFDPSIPREKRNKYIPENLVERYALVDIVSYMEAEEAVA